MTETDMLAQFIQKLASCEFMSLYTILPDLIREECMAIQNYMEVDYFDNNYKEFISWWDSTIVPIVEQYQKHYEERNGV